MAMGTSECKIGLLEECIEYNVQYHTLGETLIPHFIKLRCLKSGESWGFAAASYGWRQVLPFLRVQQFLSQCVRGSRKLMPPAVPRNGHKNGRLRLDRLRWLGRMRVWGNPVSAEDQRCKLFGWCCVWQWFCISVLCRRMKQRSLLLTRPHRLFRRSLRSI